MCECAQEENNEIDCQSLDANTTDCAGAQLDECKDEILDALKTINVQKKLKPCFELVKRNYGDNTPSRSFSEYSEDSSDSAGAVNRNLCIKKSVVGFYIRVSHGPFLDSPNSYSPIYENFED